MATITLNIPDGVMPRVVDALCSDYPGGFLDQANQPTITRAQYAKQKIGGWILDAVEAYEGDAAVNQARVTARNQTRTEISIT